MAVMEITTYVVPPANRDAFDRARPAIAAGMADLDGLERVESVDLGGGRRADVAVWRDADALAAAVRAAGHDERLAPLFTLVEDVQLQHGPILA